MATPFPVTLSSALTRLLLPALLLGLFAITPDARALDWLPVTDEDRDASASTIDPDAGAEILHRIKQIDDSKGSGVTEEYIRIKVYNEKGVRQISKIDVPYDEKNERIRSIEARVIKPGGSIVDVDKKDFYDREIIKYGNVRVRVRSFSFPTVEPGAIVEYKWRRTSRDNIYALKLDFVSELPSRRVRFRIKPHQYGMGYRTVGFFFKCGERPMEKDKDDFSSVEMTDVKAGLMEPFMPPADDVQPWMLFYPTRGPHMAYWSFISQGLAALGAERTRKISKLVSQTAAQITQGMSVPGEQFAAINDYCHTRITNVNLDTTPGADDKRRSDKGPRSADEIIKTGRGDTLEIQLLFLALAKARGLDATLALCSRRSDGIFTEKLPVISRLPDPLVATHFMEEWHYYDPARREVETGMLHWENEGRKVLVPHTNGFRFLITPDSPVEKSRTKRAARLALDGQGTLEGDVSIEYTGHAAIDARERFQNETPARLVEKVRDIVQARMPLAELDDVRVSSPGELKKPFVLSYKIRVPSYAESAGQRLFIQPGFFSKGLPAIFTAATRAYDICFNYSTLTEDDVVIKMPDGFQIEEGSTPGTLNRTNWGRYDIEIARSISSNTIIYKRILEFLPVRVPAGSYQTVKRIFDFVNQQDAHTLTLKKHE